MVQTLNGLISEVSRFYTILKNKYPESLISEERRKKKSEQIQK